MGFHPCDHPVRGAHLAETTRRQLGSSISVKCAPYCTQVKFHFIKAKSPTDVIGTPFPERVRYAQHRSLRIASHPIVLSNAGVLIQEQDE